MSRIVHIDHMNNARTLELKNVDLNLLVVFRQLLHDRHVSKAAESLGLSQPGISNALNRLRQLFDDKLFVRTSRGMQPTPFAEALADPLIAALGAIQGTLNRRSLFDPLVSSRQFVIAMADVGEIYFLPRLMGRLTVAAPSVGIDAVSNRALNLKELLEEGKVDLAIGFLPELKTDVYQRRLFRQRYVCLFREGHPLGGADFTVENFGRASHVIVMSGKGHARINELVDRAVRGRTVKLRIPHFVALPEILQATDLIATVPEKIAEHLVRSFRLEFVRHPVVLPDFQINLFWHAKYHHEPGNQWLRGLICDQFVE